MSFHHPEHFALLMTRLWRRVRGGIILLLSASATPTIAQTLPTQSEMANFDLRDLTSDESSGKRSSSPLGADRDIDVRETPALLAPEPQLPKEAKSISVPERYRSFGGQVDAVKWEMAAILGYYTAINAKKLWENPTTPHFHREGWFGKETSTLGVDKLAHAYSGYVISEIVYARLKRKTGNAPGIAVTAAALGFATTLYSELWDSIERGGGWGWEDVAFDAAGAGFSLLRNSVPGLDQKLDYRLMIMPKHGIRVSGQRHFEQQRYFFAVKLWGFEAFKEGPLRFLELHAGYYAKDFTSQARARGLESKRRVFLGVGINLRELLFKSPRGPIGRAAGEALDYLQPPYTAAHWHLTN